MNEGRRANPSEGELQATAERIQERLRGDGAM
jgi:hypothetical protein